MRTRSIKPGFFNNDILGDLPPLTRLLFIGLWCLADREGRLEDRPKRIKKELLGYDDVNSDDVDEMLQELHKADFILRYEVQGERYIQVINFTKHQNPHVKEKGSEIPAPEGYTHRPEPLEIDEETGEITEYEESTVQAPDKHGALTVQAGLVPGNRLPNTDYLSPTPGNAQGSAEAETPEQRTSTNQKRFELFWAAYPEKVGKKAAQQAWKNAKVDSDLFDKIMNAIGRARVTEQWRRENGRYVPNPATWLNQGRWDDEYKEVDENGGTRSDHRKDGDEPAAAQTRRSGLAGTGFKLAGEPEDGI
ncbi:MAG: hypothetical protein RR365_00495 [Bacteroides sp.]